MFLANYLGLLHQSEMDLAEGFRKVGKGHAAEVDVFHVCHVLAEQCDAHAEKLESFVDRYGEQRDEEPERLYHDLFDETRNGSFGLLRDLQDLHVLGSLVQTTWTVLVQGAQGLHDRELLELARACSSETSRQLAWLTTRMKAAAPQALLMAP